MRRQRGRTPLVVARGGPQNPELTTVETGSLLTRQELLVAMRRRSGRGYAVLQFGHTYTMHRAQLKMCRAERCRLGVASGMTNMTTEKCGKSTFTTHIAVWLVF